MQITVMNIEDYQAVYGLWRRTPGMGMRSLDDSQEGIAKFLKRNPTTCFVAKDKLQVIGVIMAGHDGRRGYIYHTAVDEKYRGQGIARNLVEQCKEALIQEGIKKVALVAFQNNAIGNAFWQAMGFTSRDDLVYRNLSLDINNQ